MSDAQVSTIYRKYFTDGTMMGKLTSFIDSHSHCDTISLLLTSPFLSLALSLSVSFTLSVHSLPGWAEWRCVLDGMEGYGRAGRLRAVPREGGLGWRGTHGPSLL